MNGRRRVERNDGSRFSRARRSDYSGAIFFPGRCAPTRKRLRFGEVRRQLQAQPILHMSSLYEQLRADIVTAMKARDSVTATALRTADAAIKRAAMDTNKDIDDALVIATIRKAVKNLADA